MATSDLAAGVEMMTARLRVKGHDQLAFHEPDALRAEWTLGCQCGWKERITIPQHLSGESVFALLWPVREHLMRARISELEAQLVAHDKALMETDVGQLRAKLEMAIRFIRQRGGDATGWYPTDGEATTLVAMLTDGVGFKLGK